jgi:hypothetical protein
VNAAKALGDVLQANGVCSKVGDNLPWPLYFSREPSGTSSEDAVVTLYNTGGSEGSPKWLLDFPTVQARVRGKPNGYEESRAKAQEVRDALQGIDSFDALDGSGDRIVSVRLRTEIADIGYDDKNRPLHTVNFDLIVEPAQGTNRLPIS